MEIREILELMKAVSDNGLTAFTLEEGNLKLSMEREPEKKILADPISVFSGASSKETVPSEEEPEQVIQSPLVGTFYSSPAPDADDFIKVGDRVKKGQIVGIVEAMKLMNEIESDRDGIVEEVLVKNEDTVEFGQPLFKIR